MAAELYTTVKNVSGVQKVFSFLGPRGMELAIDEVVTLPGDLVTKLGNMPSRRRFDALERSLSGTPTLAILSTPVPILYDATNGGRTVVSASDVIGVDDPSWGAVTV